MALKTYIRNAIGTIDGVSTVFYTPDPDNQAAITPYSPGTVVLFINGQAKQAANDDGCTETNPDAGEVTLKEAPQVGDIVQFLYAVAGAEVEKTEGLYGVLLEGSLIVGLNWVQMTMTEVPTTDPALSMYVGENKIHSLSVLDGDGNPQDLTGCKLYFTVREKECETEPEVLIYKDSTDPADIEILIPATDGLADIKIDPLDTTGMVPGNYRYDVWLELATGAKHLISGPGTFTLKQPVTLDFVPPA
jgi:hypothetical protein